MSGFVGLESKEVVRIKAKKYDSKLQPEYKKFSIDPQITSFEMLQGILARAFDMKGDFLIYYLAKDNEDQDIYLTMLSDWDMDAAIQCSSNPFLKLKIDKQQSDTNLDDWDIIATTDVPIKPKETSTSEKGSLLYSITGTINQIGKSMSSLQKVIGLKSDNELYKSTKAPMNDAEFHNYLDSDGVLLKPREFRYSIYQGGAEPSLRRVTWRHLCNIYPIHLTGRERFEYLKNKEKEYYRLREDWRIRYSNNTITDEVKHVISMVRKDALRTDRSHKFFAGSDDNENVLKLFNILVTYALTHPNVSYCQGMSDIASPILVIENEEAQAYICFVGVMKRLQSNFKPDGQTIMLQFKHLSLLLQIHDPEFHSYLQAIRACDLFFCYRWLLLELKREFSFNDALYMKEVMWSTLPADPPETDLQLADLDYNEHFLSTSPCSPTFIYQQSIYAKQLSMRYPGESHKHNNEYFPGNSSNNNRIFHSPPSDPKSVITQEEHFERFNEEEMLLNISSTTDYYDKKDKLLTCSTKTTDSAHQQNEPMSQFDMSLESSVENVLFSTNNLPSCVNNDTKVSSFVNDTEVSSCVNDTKASSCVNDTKVSSCVNDTKVSSSVNDTKVSSSVNDTNVSSTINVNDTKVTSGINDTHVSQCSNDTNTPSISKDTTLLPSEGKAIKKDFRTFENLEKTTSYSTTENNSSTDSHTPKVNGLPPPEEFGCGNPFLMYLCLSLLLQNRNIIMKNNMDYEEVVIYFDKLVRRHNVHKALYSARHLYCEYLKSVQDAEESGFNV